ncbi:hypothetical protein EON64_16375 [archaeon]|nr:MAG: hypothetical protein EON64_16375 [archaeon]
MLEAELTAHLERPVEFFVYNVQTDEVRVCVLMPSLDWGAGGAGDGVLGAQVGHVYSYV